MQKKLTSAFIVALMLASCFASAFAVTETEDADPILVSPAPSGEDGFVIGETYAIHSVYDNERMFDELNKLLHMNGPALLDMIYELVNENMEEKMTKEEFKAFALDTIAQLASMGLLSEEVKTFLDGFIQHPGMVNLDYATVVALVDDLCKVLSLVLTTLSEETFIISVDEFNFEITADTIAEITRLSTYEFQLAESATFTIALDLILDLNGTKLNLEDAELTLGVNSLLWFSQAPKDATYKFDSCILLDFCGKSNFINSDATNILELITEPGSMRNFDMNAEIDATAELSVYPGIDFPFFESVGESTISIVGGVAADIKSNTPLIKGLLEGITFPVSKAINLEIPVDVAKTSSGTMITNDDWGLSILMTKGPIEFSINNDDFSIDLKFNGKDALSIDIKLTSEDKTVTVSIVYENETLTVTLNGTQLVKITKDEMTIDPKDYYGEDLVLTDAEVAMLNDDMSERAKACGHPNLWRAIPIGDIITAEFFIDGMDGAIQTEQLIAGGLVSTPGFFIHDEKVILEWIADGGLVYNYYDTYIEDVAFYGKEYFLLDEVPAEGKMSSGCDYALVTGDDIIIPVASMTSGATLTVIGSDMSWLWTLGALEGDDLSETILDIGVQMVDPPNNSSYIAKVIGDRQAVYLDLAASGKMPSISTMILYTEMYFAEGQQLDVYCDTGKELVLMETGTTNGGCLTFDVPHCSMFIVAEHADQGSDNTILIVAAIVVVLIIIVAAFFVLKKKKTGEN